MGLDMHLSARRYYSNVSWRGDQCVADFEKLKEVSGAGTVLEKVALPYIYLDASIGYWRKQNAIHNWFVNECQEGSDDCRRAYVSREQLETLKSLCEQVQADKALANELLPTTEGFFFGDTEYGEWYDLGLVETIEIVNTALSMSDEWEFEYCSSW